MLRKKIQFHVCEHSISIFTLRVAVYASVISRHVAFDSLDGFRVHHRVGLPASTVLVDFVALEIWEKRKERFREISHICNLAALPYL